jgi:hypothetical protein
MTVRACAAANQPASHQLLSDSLVKNFSNRERHDGFVLATEEGIDLVKRVAGEVEGDDEPLRPVLSHQHITACFRGAETKSSQLNADREDEADIARRNIPERHKRAK